MYRIRFILGMLIIVLLIGVLPAQALASQQIVRGSQEEPLKVEAINGEDMDKFLKNALHDRRVRMLDRLVVDLHGYVLRLDAAIATRVSHNGKEIIRVVLVPYQHKDGKWIRHIAFWEGEWDGIYDRGAIATDGKDKVYVLGKDGIRQISVDDLENDLILPLNAIVGPTPPWVPRYTEKVSTFSQQRSTMGTVRPMVTYWKQVDIAITAYTLLGFVAYRFHQVKSWMYDGNIVTNVNVFVYLSDVDPNFVYRGLVNQNDEWGPGRIWHDSFRQGHVENCIARYGCIGSTYPYLEIRAKNNGEYEIPRWGF